MIEQEQETPERDERARRWAKRIVNGGMALFSVGMIVALGSWYAVTMDTRFDASRMLVMAILACLWGLIFGQKAGMREARDLMAQAVHHIGHAGIKVVMERVESGPERKGVYTPDEHGIEYLIEARYMLDLIERGQAYIRDDDDDHFVLEGERPDFLAGVTMRYLLVIHRDHSKQEEEA